MATDIREYVYLDNNATTPPYRDVCSEIVSWMNCGNASATHVPATYSRELLAQFRKYLLDFCRLDARMYHVLFTSGATQSNYYIIELTARRFSLLTGKLPHIVITDSEHSSVRHCVERLKADKLAYFDVAPLVTQGENYGKVDVAALTKLIRPNTCLICVAAVNSETGVINPIYEIGKIALRHKKPCHVDAVQLFGKSAVRMMATGITSVSASFHKFHGPVGVGALIVCNEVLTEGLKVAFDEKDTQNYGLIGGTVPVAPLAGAFLATKITMISRDDKNEAMLVLKNKLLTTLARVFDVVWAADIADMKKFAPKTPTIVVLGSHEHRKMSVPSTIMFSVYGENICALKIRDALMRRGVIIGLGSACSTGAGQTAHAASALGLPDGIAGGLIRVSWSDLNSSADIDKFLAAYVDMIAKKEHIMR